MIPRQKRQKNTSEKSMNITKIVVHSILLVLCGMAVFLFISFVSGIITINDDMMQLRNLQQINGKKNTHSQQNLPYIVELTPSVYIFDKDLTISQIPHQESQQQISFESYKNSYKFRQVQRPHRPKNQPTINERPQSKENIKIEEVTKSANSPPRSKVVAGIDTAHGQQWKKFIDLKTKGISSELAQEQKKYYEQKYGISHFQELPFCIFIPSFKNVAKDRYLHNIRSVLQQDYSNYRILFVDDMSDDGTGQAIKQYAMKHHISEEKMKIIINTERKMAMRNIHYAANQFCKPYQIFMIVDGDDQLVGKQVFKFFNAIYQSQQLWVAYSNFMTSRGGIGYSRDYSVRVKKISGYRKSGFMISHLRTFYTKLFTLIEEKDLKDQLGQWYHAANDVAMYIPILEMSGERVNYIPELNYLYNPATGLNNHKVRLKEQKGNDRAIRKKQPYHRLEELFTQQQLMELIQHTGKKIPITDGSVPSDTQTLQGWQRP